MAQIELIISSQQQHAYRKDERALQVQELEESSVVMAVPPSRVGAEKRPNENESSPPSSSVTFVVNNSTSGKVVAAVEPADEASQHGQNKRKRHRRGKAKKSKLKKKAAAAAAAGGKPYYKLTLKEVNELEEREARRTAKMRERRFKNGQPVAPCNTTQFLIEDHNVKEPDLALRLKHLNKNGDSQRENLHQDQEHHHHHHNQNREASSQESSEYFYSSPEDEEEFLVKEFSEAYDSVHAERLSSMTKTELVTEYIQLEERVDTLEQRIKNMDNAAVAVAEVVNVKTVDTEVQTWDTESVEKARIFEEEIRKLTLENERLRQENRTLLQKNHNGTPLPSPEDKV